MSQKLTPELRDTWLAEVRQAASENRAPYPVAGIHGGAGPRRPDVAQPQAASGDVFTGSDLTPALLNNSQRFEIPGTGKHLWVFPASPDDVKSMIHWSLRPEDLRPDPADPGRAQAARTDLEIDIKVAQVILCTRQGPTRDSRRCFEAKHIPALAGMLGHPTVVEICRISDELSGSEEALGASARRFFNALRISLRTSLSACDGWENCPPGLTDTLRRWQSLVTRTALRGSFDSGLMNDLRELEARL